MRGSGSACYINNALYTHFIFYTDWLICVILVIFHDVGPIGIHVRDVHQAKIKKRCNVSTPSPVHAHNSSAPHTMFDISIDESGKTYSAPELVKDKSEAEIGNARKRKYFCVTCVGVKHPVSLKTRRTFDHVGKKARNYTALAWFSHHGGGKCGAPKAYKNEACSETATHWQAKHILCEHVGAYRFETFKCVGCTKHTKIEDGAGAVGRVEYTEKKSEGTFYRFDAVLMRNNAVSSVLEVWATHETSEQKREYCLQQGYTFAEFHAAHVVEAHKKAAPGEVFMLENLKKRVFQCQECAQARRELELRIEQERLRKIESEKLRAIVAAEKRRLDMLEVAKQQKLYEQELETKRVLEKQARDNEVKLQAVRLEERRKAAELEKKRQAIRLEEERIALELEGVRQEKVYAEYYNKTSAGQQTHILQLQETLHCNYLYMVWIKKNSTPYKDFLPYQLYCDGNSFIEKYGAFPCKKASHLATIRDTKAWFGFHREKAKQSAQLHVYSSTSQSYIEYEKGVSFKCICGKWAHPHHSYPECTEIYRSSMRHTAFDALVKQTKVWVKDFTHTHYIDPSDRTTDFEEASDPYFMACGRCLTSCVFCNKRFLLVCAAKDGCCGSCTFKTIHDIDTKKMSVSAHIKTTITQLKSDIARICPDIQA